VVLHFGIEVIIFLGFAFVSTFSKILRNHSSAHFIIRGIHIFLLFFDGGEDLVLLVIARLHCWLCCFAHIGHFLAYSREEALTLLNSLRARALFMHHIFHFTMIVKILLLLLLLASLRRYRFFPRSSICICCPAMILSLVFISIVRLPLLLFLVHQSLICCCFRVLLASFTIR